MACSDSTGISGSEGPAGTEDQLDDGRNQPPVASAGPDLQGVVPEEVTLDGTGSSDPDGDALTFTWALTDRPEDSDTFLLGETTPRARFFPDRAGEYVVELTVDDGLASATDEVIIDVSAPNEGPVANAGGDQTVTVGDEVTVDGSASYDPDDDPLTYAWFLRPPSNSSAELSDRAAVSPTFTADVVGTYVVELRVTDGVDVSQVDSVDILAEAEDAGGGGCFSCAGAEVEERWAGGYAATVIGLLALVGIRRRRRA